MTVKKNKNSGSTEKTESLRIQAENSWLAAENAGLRESLEQYHGIVELSPDGIITLDLEGRILTCNRAFLDLSGYSKKEILNHHVSRLPVFAPEHLPGYLKIFKSLMRSRKPSRMEFSWVHKSGELRTAEAHIGFLKKSGRVVGVQAFLRDITMRIEVEQALRESEQWERSLFEGSLDAIFIVDRNGHLVDVNPAAEDLTGYSRKELMRMSVPDLHAPEDLGPFQDFFNRIMSGVDITSIARILKKDGSKVESEFSNRRIMIGGEIYMHAIARDITERKRTERMATQLGLIVENSVNEVYIFDAETLKFVLVNHGARGNLGYSMEELRDLTPLDLKPEFTLESFSQKINPLRTGEKSVLKFNASHRRKDGSLYPVEVFLQLAEFNLRPAFAAIILDITERKKAEKKIQKSLKEKEVLLQEVHHRVKNNMQIVSSLLRLQSSGIQDTELLTRFQETQNRILSMALIHEKLYKTTDYSRINFGGYLRDLVSNLLKTYEVEPEKVKLLMNLEDIFVDINTAIPCGLIVNELISNVLKHAFPQDRSGSMTIGLRFVGRAKAELTVSDNGIGLSGDIDSSSSLGLQLVKHLVQQLDAEISLQADRGTQIQLLFPLPKADIT